MKTTLGIEFEPFFPQISHRAKIGCAKYDLSTGEGVAMEQWYLNMGEVPGTPLSQIVGIYSNVKPEDRECLKTSLSRLVHGETDHDQGEVRVRDGEGWKWVRLDIMEAGLESLTSVFLRFMKRRVGMVASTVFSGLFLNIVTADQYISIILTGNMFKDIYKKKGYESRLLSRTTEDSVTVTSVLVPWNTCGMTQATILGVATLTYLPYCFFNLISPLMSITMAAIGFKIKQHHEEDQSIIVN